MELLIIQGIILIGSLIWGYYQSRSHKEEDPEPAGLDTSRLPTLADRPLPVAFGRVWIMSPQVLCYNGPTPETYDGVDYDSRTAGTGYYNPVFPMGRSYRMNLHLGLCTGKADSVTGVMFDGERLTGTFRNAFGPVVDVPFFHVDGTALRITSPVPRIVNEKNRLGGGPPSKPGFMGEFWISYGGAGDTFPPEAKDWISNTAGGRTPPDFKGITSIVSHDFWSGEIPPEQSEIMGLLELGGACYLGDSQQPPPFGIELTRVMRGWDGNAQWYAAAAAVYDGDTFVGMNPVHVIRELLTSEIYGLNEPTSRIDDASFTAAADTLVSDRIGINILWETQVAIRELVDEVLKVAEGILWFDHSTAKWKLTMVRADYVTADTPIIGKDAVVRVDGFDRPSWDNLPNQVTVSYRDKDNWEDINYTITNSSLQALAHRIVPMTVRYASVTNKQLAATLASRDLRQSGTPLARVTLKLKPEWPTLRPGDVVRWTSSDHGIVEMPLRIMAVNIGDGRNNEVVIRCVEDVFGLGVALYPPPDDSPWVPPEQTPAPPEHRHLYEAPYWMVKRAGLADPPVTQIDVGADSYGGYVAQLAARSQTDSTGYLLDASHDNGATYQEARPFVAWQARSTLRGSIGAGDIAIKLDAIVTPGSWPAGTILMLVDSYGGEEIAVVTGVGSVAQTLTVARGCLDTVPSAWAAGAEVWVPSTDAIVPTPTDGPGMFSPSVHTKARSITSRGVLPRADAIADGPVFPNQRWPRPYPPTAVLLDDAWRGPKSYPQTVVRGDLSLGWAYRRRTGSESLWPGSLPMHATPDSDEACAVEVRAYSDDSLLASYAPAGDSQTIPASLFDGHSDAYILLWTTRAKAGMRESWQRVRLDFAILDNLLAANVATGTDALSDTTGFTFDGPVMSIESSTDHAHTGSRSLKVIGIDGNLVTQVTGVAAGDYAATMWARTASGPCDVGVALQRVSDGVGVEVYATLTPEWQMLTVRMDGVPADDTLRIMLFADGGALDTIYLDTLAMTRDQ